jgi:ZIP family zinc transporter
MSTTQLLVLGALAGFTIFLGLPIGRIKSASTRLKAGLSAMATGILLFLLWDVLVHGIEPVEEALTSATDKGGSWLDFVQLAVTFAAGATIGLMSLVYYDRWFGRQRSKAMLGPGAASRRSSSARGWQASRRGLARAADRDGHRAAQLLRGLAIGQSAAQDQVTLALVLIIGFGLHNATEGFGIVSPLSGSETRPTWKFLFLLGLIGGGPTFVGTLLGHVWVNETVSVAFLALAAGSILYVVIQLMNVNQKLGYKTLVAWMLLAGLFLGFATDFIIEASGV